MRILLPFFLICLCWAADRAFSCSDFKSGMKVFLVYGGWSLAIFAPIAAAYLLLDYGLLGFWPDLALATGLFAVAFAIGRVAPKKCSLVWRKVSRKA